MVNHNPNHRILGGMMEKTRCPVCGEKLDSRGETVDTCPKCAARDDRMMEKGGPDREVYLNARDYSAPENYPGY